jgi:hypothetical protein
MRKFETEARLAVARVDRRSLGPWRSKGVLDEHLSEQEYFRFAFFLGGSY